MCAAGAVLQVAEIAKAVSETPCGGQIIITGETMAEIRSMSSLLARVADCLDGWKSMAESASVNEQKAAMTIMHLGSHIVRSPNASYPKADQDTTPLHIVVEVREQDDGESSNRSSHEGLPVVEKSGFSTKLQRSQISKALEQTDELLEVIPWPLRYRAM